MGFSLGGIIKGAIGTVAHSIPGVSQVYDAIQAVGGIVKGGGTAGKIISTSIAPLPAPSVVAPRVDTSMSEQGYWLATPGVGDGRKWIPVTGGGVAVARVSSGPPPLLSQGGGFGDVSSGGSSTAVVRRSHFGGGKKRRRMNPMNVRAVRRAVTRIHSAEKLFRKIFSLTHPGKGAGHITPKRRKR